MVNASLIRFASLPIEQVPRDKIPLWLAVRKELFSFLRPPKHLIPPEYEEEIRTKQSLLEYLYPGALEEEEFPKEGLTWLTGGRKVRSDFAALWVVEMLLKLKLGAKDVEKFVRVVYGMEPYKRVRKSDGELMELYQHDRLWLSTADALWGEKWKQVNEPLKYIKRITWITKIAKDMDENTFIHPKIEHLSLNTSVDDEEEEDNAHWLDFIPNLGCNIRNPILFLDMRRPTRAILPQLAKEYEESLIDKLIIPAKSEEEIVSAIRQACNTARAHSKLTEALVLQITSDGPFTLRGAVLEGLSYSEKEYNTIRTSWRRKRLQIQGLISKVLQ